MTTPSMEDYIEQIYMLIEEWIRDFIRSVRAR